MSLAIRPAEECRWDAISLGEVMLRFDPEWGRIRTTRHFRVSEGGGEYNVTRALRKVFGMRTAVVTAGSSPASCSARWHSATSPIATHSPCSSVKPSTCSTAWPMVCPALSVARSPCSVGSRPQRERDHGC